MVEGARAWTRRLVDIGRRLIAFGGAQDIGHLVRVVLVHLAAEGARGTGKGELEGGDAVDGRDDARARDGVVLVDDECDDEANEGETCERWRDARWRCARAR